MDVYKYLVNFICPEKTVDFDHIDDTWYRKGPNFYINDIDVGITKTLMGDFENTIVIVGLTNDKWYVVLPENEKRTNGKSSIAALNPGAITDFQVKGINSE